MKPKSRKTKDIADLKPAGGDKTRPANAPLDQELTDTFNEVQAEKFRGDSHSSIDATIADPDVEDTKGGE